MKLQYKVTARKRALLSQPATAFRWSMLAAFALETDAYWYADHVRKDNPTWVVEIRYPNVIYPRYISASPSLAPSPAPSPNVSKA